MTRTGYRDGAQPPPSISSLTVSGFKSIAAEQTIDVRPLTLLAGANSSGKSSMMQALLLLKQTLEASYDPGPLLLNGPNVRFSSADQMLFHAAGSPEAKKLLIRIQFRPEESVETAFGRDTGKRLDIQQCTFKLSGASPIVLTPDMPAQTILARLPLYNLHPEELGLGQNSAFRVVRDRCFLRPEIGLKGHSDELRFFSTNRKKARASEPPGLSRRCVWRPRPRAGTSPAARSV